MSADTLLAFALFIFVTSATPGPNNVMVLASGVNFGFRASLPHILGISGGVMLMTVTVGLGLASLFARHPGIHEVVRWAGGAYLLYLAWRIAMAAAPASSGERRAPMGFWAAAGFQWANPKAWVMVLGVCSNYLPSSGGSVPVIGLALLFALINAPVVCLWALFGVRLRRFLLDARSRRRFNFIMAALLVASLGPMLSG